MAVFEFADAPHAVRLAECGCDVGQAETERLQPARIDIDGEFARRAAQDIDTGDTRHRDERRQHLQFGKPAQRGRIERFRGQRDAKHGKYARIGTADVEAGAGGEVWQYGCKRTLGRKLGGDNVVAPIKIYRDLSRPSAGRRANSGHAGHCP